MVGIRYLKYNGNIYQCQITQLDKDSLSLKFDYSEGLKNEIKESMGSARWNPANKTWTVPDNHRTKFVLDYLSGNKPYAHYDKPLIEHKTTRSVYDHQADMVRH